MLKVKESTIVVKTVVVWTGLMVSLLVTKVTTFNRFQNLVNHFINHQIKNYKNLPLKYK